ncbi:MAG TPA: hypothetical protein VLW06_01565 [Terriglobales bacterium]|nr:hypothetical protein [Terriglobales bacterium]
MAIVVVGGHSRSVGKTSVVAGLIAALRAYNWTAFKVTQFGHGRCSLNGRPCQCETADHSWAMTEEKDGSGESDSSRFLVAGAKRSYWVRTAQGQLEKAVPAIQRRINEAENTILESNSILKFIQPDLYLTVLDPATEDFKASAHQFLSRADAIILHGSERTPRWADVSLARENSAARLFRINPPPYVSDEVVDFVESRLQSLSAARLP